MRKQYFLKLLLVSCGLLPASLAAVSIRDVLGDELNSSHPGHINLDLSYKGIDNLDGLAQVAASYPNLQGLNLSYNNIREIPGGAFLGFGNLKSLSLSYNKMC